MRVLVSLALCAAALLPSAVRALYSSSDAVEQVDGKSFKKTILQADKTYLVEFYAPWCGHCKNLVPEWKKAATALNGIVGVAAVDATAEGSQPLASQYGVSGFPTIKIFFPGLDQPEDYQGGRTAAEIVDYTLSKLREKAQQRMKGGSKASSSSSSSSSSGGSGGKSAVVELTEASFDKEVLQGKDPWIVEFYAPWCGHCKNLAPEFARAAAKTEGEGVRFGAVDATAHASLGQRFEVRGYPTIKFFRPEATTDSQAEDYEGGRTAADFVSFAQILAEESQGPVEIRELTDAAGFDAVCKTDKVCVVAFVPDIFASSKAEREGYLATFRAVASKNRRLFNFMWAAGGSQPALEAQLGLTFGFPAVAAVHRGKSLYAVMTAAYVPEKLGQFLIGLGTGGASGIRPLPAGGLVAVATTEAWDGQDAPQEDDDGDADDSFSLEDLAL